MLPLGVASRPSTGIGVKSPSGSLIDIWNDLDQTPKTRLPGPEKRPTIRSVSTENLPLRSSTKTSSRLAGNMVSAKEPLHDTSLALDYNPAVVSYVSNGRVQNPRSLRRRNMSSASTIFKNSPLAPITIIVTTPEEESPSSPPTPATASQPRNSFNQIRAHRESSSLPSRRANWSSPNLTVPDSNMLKPPTEQQINTSKLRKAHEFREIRRFLIQFMNAKGDQFPKKLRWRMMDMYCITDSDLSPEIVAKFIGEVKDEGVSLEQLGISEMDSTDADDLKILETAFRSRIPVVTPRREQALVDSIPPPRPRKQSLTRRAETRKENKEGDDDLLTWLAPLITTSLHSAPPLDNPPPQPFTSDHKLIRASSVPNLQRPQPTDTPPVPSIPAAYEYSVNPVNRARNCTLSGGTPGNTVTPADTGKQLRIIDQQTRLKRRNIIFGAFDSIKKAISSSKAVKAAAAEKKSLLKEAA